MLARREFLQDLAGAVADQQLSVLLSSHLVADLERVCDYLIVLVGARVRVAGDVDQSCSRPITGSPDFVATQRRPWPAGWQIISESHAGRQTTLIVRADAGLSRPGLDRLAGSMEDLVLAYI